MSKRGLRVVVAVVLAIVLALVLWRRGHGHETTARTATAGSAGAWTIVTARGAADPATGVPRWLGASGIPSRKIAGIVVDEAGKPVAGATVRLANEYSNSGLMPAPSKQTDSTGRFEFGVQPSTMFVVSAEQSKLTAALLRVNLGDPYASPPPDQLRLVLHPCTASIHGTIYDTVGGTIPHATVARLDKFAVTQVVAEADDAGAYELCLPAGGSGVAISADGYAVRTEEVDIYGRTRRDFQLVPGTPVIGKVVRADDHTPVAGAVVEINSGDPRAYERQVTSSGEDGTFHFDAIAPGRHSVSARGDRLASRGDVEITTELGVPTSDVVVAVSSTYTVSGRVVLRGTQNGLGGHTVVLMAQGKSGRRGMGMRSWAESRDDGSFAIDGVEPGSYAPVVDRSYDVRIDTSKLVEVKDADVTGVIIESDPVGSIAGRVMHDGKPVDGADVRVQGGNSYANDEASSEGAFELTGLAAGEYQIYAESHLAGAFTKGPKVTLAAGEHKRDVVIDLDLAASIAGVVVDQNDAPVAGVSLRFSLLGGQDFGSATTADDGTFTARAMSGGGDYIYEVRQTERSQLIYPPAVGKRFPPVTVPDGNTHITGLRIKVRYERLAISGHLVDMNGKPVADATVSASPDGAEMWWMASSSAMTDQAGAFTIRELPAGSYTVDARTPKGNAQAEAVAAGSTNVVLKVRAGGGIDGTLEGFTQTPEVFAFGLEGQQRIEATVTGSTFQLRNLPAGRYRLVARTKDDSDAIGVDVVSEQITKATLALRAKGTITGTVVDKNHKPVGDLRCMAMPKTTDEAKYDGAKAFAMSDAKGAFTITNAPAGSDEVVCFGADVNAWDDVTVVANQTVNVELVTNAGFEGGRDLGMELDDQLSDVVVSSVVPNGPAAKAGIVVGDALDSVDGKKVQRYQAEMIMNQLAYAPGNDHTLVLERKDKEVTVTLKLEPPPAVP